MLSFFQLIYRHSLIDSLQFSSSIFCFISELCHLLRINRLLVLRKSFRMAGVAVPSKRSLIVIRSDCGIVQRLPMIAHPTILMLTACHRPWAASNRRSSHDALRCFSLSIRDHVLLEGLPL